MATWNRQHEAAAWKVSNPYTGPSISVSDSVVPRQWDVCRGRICRAGLSRRFHRVALYMFCQYISISGMQVNATSGEKDEAFPNPAHILQAYPQPLVGDLSSVLSERELQYKLKKIPNVSTHSVLVLELDPLQPGVGQLLIPQKLLRGRLSSHIPTFPQDGQ